ncbi:BA14K-like protein [Cohaesibacter sp. ES.047]|uniref:BA14K family protein n=1 Tax=Cohaesibacter sp. ES.047 TaxID=1798205 RepID=UPI000BB93ECC|nr:BA14K family protein [Cohaesibacter sp. ES.047]SNY90156.1 BA14K-like protein [Cohaesibacter sp. ES.047]
MKRQIAAAFMAACIGMVAVPVSAEPLPPFKHFKKERHYNDKRNFKRHWGRNDHRRPRMAPRNHRRHHRDDDDNGAALAAGAIFGAIAGTILSDMNKRQAPPPEYGGYCNYDACANRYRSFRGSDCTFQPYNGPRRYCRM